MMWYSVVLLAIIQGVAEFLPISSTAHLLLAKQALGVESPSMRLELVLHLGTAVAIVLYYRQRLGEIFGGMVRGAGAAWRRGLLLVLATVPAALLWLWCGEWVDAVLSAPRRQLVVLAAMLAVTGVVLLSTRRARRSDHDEVTVRQAWWMGCAQALAIVPGISRSGSTIAVARHLGVQPRGAAEFSFLMSLPVVLGGMAVDLWRGAPSSAGGDVLSVYHYVAGALIAAAVGYLVIGKLIRFLCRGHYWVFGVYCLALSATLLVCRWCGAL